MTPVQVEQKIIELKHRQPFVPFFVELMDGQSLEIGDSFLAVNAGGAGFFGADGALIDFVFSNVRSIRVARSEAAR
jgi:hypothetical protein